MIDGQELLGETAAELMDTLEEEYKETNHIIREVIVIARLEGSDDEDEWSTAHWRSSTGIRSHQLGLLYTTIEAMHEQHRRRQEEDDD